MQTQLTNTNGAHDMLHGYGGRGLYIVYSWVDQWKTYVMQMYGKMSLRTVVVS